MRHKNLPEKIAVTRFWGGNAVTAAWVKISMFSKTSVKLCVWKRVRTPYGVFNGQIKGYDPLPVRRPGNKECMRRVAGKVRPEDIDYVVMGHGCSRRLRSGSQPSATILAGLPESIPVHHCQQSMLFGIKTIDLAAQMIQFGRADICDRRRPGEHDQLSFLPARSRDGRPDGAPQAGLVDLMVNDGFWGAFYNRHMALHGSEVADEFGFTRADHDEWGLSPSAAVRP